MSPPTPEHDQSSAQMDQSSAVADRSSTTADTTPASAAPHPDRHGDAMAETSDNKAVELDKAEIKKTDQQPSTPNDHPMADAPDAPDESDEPDCSNQSTQPAGKPTPNRPALKREFTPPHRINIWSRQAWKTERAYSNVHDHVTKTLNQIRKQQVESDRKGPAARRMELDIYKAADSCTLSLEYLVGHFSTKFFHHTGPENIMGMIATIAADAAALDDLRLRQRHMSNYGYSLEKKIIQTEGHIRELAELAKRIRDKGAGDEEEEEEEEDEDEDMDAEGDSDPEVDGKGNGS